MISKNSPNVDLAMKWIDYMIGPQGQKGVIDVTAYSGASRSAIPLLGPARVLEDAVERHELRHHHVCHLASSAVRFSPRSSDRCEAEKSAQ